MLNGVSNNMAYSLLFKKYEKKIINKWKVNEKKIDK